MNGRGSSGTMWIIGGAVLVVLIGIFMFLGRPEAKLGQSATGFEGLRRWLVANEVGTRSFSGGYLIEADGVGLRIAPLYDLGPDEDRKRPTSTEELLQTEDEREMSLDAIQSKAETINTLFVVPKWRSALRLTGAAHTDFLNSERRVDAFLAKLIDGDVSVDTDTSGFSTIRADAGRAEIYAMRTMSGAGCQPVLGTANAMLVGRCKLRAGEYSNTDGTAEAYFLIEPDLLNNHGLTLGENARIAAEFLPELSGGEDILIDYAPFDWVMEDRTEAPEVRREWSDLLRYFQGPFAILWLAVISAFLLALWRGWVRFGAPERAFDDAPGAARSVATAAQARLLRISGDTTALLRAYADARIGALAADLFGTRAQASEAALWRLLERRAPHAGAALRQEAAALRKHGDGGHAMADIDTFEEAIGQVRDELER